jgi:putative hydrolase of the HAD superfamily
MLILFDIDDTLLDHSAAMRAGVATLHAACRPVAALPVFEAAWVDAMKAHFPRFLAGTLTYEEHRRARIRQTIAPTLSDRDADHLFAVYFAQYEATWALFPDVVACLDALADHRLGIVSNGQTGEQRRKLTLTGIIDRFEFVHISDVCRAAKPAAEVFLGACSAAGTTPEHSIHVGDLYETDALGARRAGLRGVWLDRTRGLPAGNEPPIIHGLSELPSFIRDVLHNDRYS